MWIRANKARAISQPTSHETLSEYEDVVDISRPNHTLSLLNQRTNHTFVCFSLIWNMASSYGAVSQKLELIAAYKN